MTELTHAQALGKVHNNTLLSKSRTEKQSRTMWDAREQVSRTTKNISSFQRPTSLDSSITMIIRQVSPPSCPASPSIKLLGRLECFENLSRFYSRKIFFENNFMLKNISTANFKHLQRQPLIIQRKLVLVLKVP